MALASILDLSLDFLASPTGHFEKGAAGARNAGEAVLLDLYRRLSDDEADALLRLLNGRIKAVTPPS